MLLTPSLVSPATDVYKTFCDVNYVFVNKLECLASENISASLSLLFLVVLWGRGFLSLRCHQYNKRLVDMMRSGI